MRKRELESLEDSLEEKREQSRKMNEQLIKQLVFQELGEQIQQTLQKIKKNKEEKIETVNETPHEKLFKSIKESPASKEEKLTSADPKFEKNKFNRLLNDRKLKQLLDERTSNEEKQARSYDFFIKALNDYQVANEETGKGKVYLTSKKQIDELVIDLKNKKKQVADYWKTKHEKEQGEREEETEVHQKLKDFTKSLEESEKLIDEAAAGEEIREKEEPAASTGCILSKNQKVLSELKKIVNEKLELDILNPNFNQGDEEDWRNKLNKTFTNLEEAQDFVSELMRYQRVLDIWEFLEDEDGYLVRDEHEDPIPIGLDTEKVEEIARQIVTNEELRKVAGTNLEDLIKRLKFLRFLNPSTTIDSLIDESAKRGALERELLEVIGYNPTERDYAKNEEGYYYSDLEIALQGLKIVDLKALTEIKDKLTGLGLEFEEGIAIIENYHEHIEQKDNEVSDLKETILFLEKTIEESFIPAHLKLAGHRRKLDKEFKKKKTRHNRLYEELKKQKSRHLSEKAALATEKTNLITERNDLQTKLDNSITERDAWKQKFEKHICSSCPLKHCSVEHNDYEELLSKENKIIEQLNQELKLGLTEKDKNLEQAINKIKELVAPPSTIQLLWKLFKNSWKCLKQQ